MVIDDYLLINCHLIIWMQYILIKIKCAEALYNFQNKNI